MLNTTDALSKQIEAISIALYIQEFSFLEKKLKDYYLDNVELDKTPIIYYYCGSENVKKNIVLNIENDGINFSEYKFLDIPKKFVNYFTLTELIKIDKKYDISLGVFKDKTIEFYHRSAYKHGFFDACEKAISMRNKLAHEMEHLSINPNKDIIDLLEKETIIELFNKEFINCDLSLMNDETVSILSNIFYIRRINTMI